MDFFFGGMGVVRRDLGRFTAGQERTPPGGSFRGRMGAVVKGPGDAKNSATEDVEKEC
jgi:hypothetical protein